MHHAEALAPSAASGSRTRHTSSDDDAAPRSIPRQWRDVLDDYRLPAGPDGFWASGRTPTHDAGRPAR